MLENYVANSNPDLIEFFISTLRMVPLTMPFWWLFRSKNLDYDDLLLMNPLIRLKRDWYYLTSKDYWRVELTQPEYFNLKDALIVNGYITFYEQGGPVLREDDYDHLAGHKQWFKSLTGHEWDPTSLYHFGKVIN